MLVNKTKVTEILTVKNAVTTILIDAKSCVSMIKNGKHSATNLDVSP